MERECLRQDAAATGMRASRPRSQAGRPLTRCRFLIRKRLGLAANCDRGRSRSHSGAKDCVVTYESEWRLVRSPNSHLQSAKAPLAHARSYEGRIPLLAPTEVLAAQHLRSIVQTLGPDRAARLRPVLLTGQLPMAERRKALREAEALARLEQQREQERVQKLSLLVEKFGRSR